MSYFSGFRDIIDTQSLKIISKENVNIEMTDEDSFKQE